MQKFLHMKFQKTYGNWIIQEFFKKFQKTWKRKPVKNLHPESFEKSFSFNRRTRQIPSLLFNIVKEDLARLEQETTQSWFSDVKLDLKELKHKPGLVAHACNASYLGGWDLENCDSRPAWAKSSREHSSSKITTAKWTGGVALAVECLLCKHEALIQTPIPNKKRNRI
jgi:hypothetical protein